ncbi:hypothetical protein DEO72_LG10g3918 [Vigna unguiculata]|uniref:Uncharacterized protein n=1 Tax=Vigna unguiculata TaxID=3917 RepID=A0A4D6NI43_VIGUN|nr:hypothetical protein DEO72_LG10g3918 [Vigna unguiculata]
MRWLGVVGEKEDEWVVVVARGGGVVICTGGRVACRLPELSEELCVSTTSEGGRLELLVSSSE